MEYKKTCKVRLYKDYEYLDFYIAESDYVKLLCFANENNLKLYKLENNSKIF